MGNIPKLSAGMMLVVKVSGGEKLIFFKGHFVALHHFKYKSDAGPLHPPFPYLVNFQTDAAIKVGAECFSRYYSLVSPRG